MIKEPVIRFDNFPDGVLLTFKWTWANDEITQSFKFDVASWRQFQLHVAADFWTLG
jgi:hypothetical protein